MKRGQYFVRGINKDGKWDSIDILDLDEESFRAWLIDHYFADDLCGMRPELIEGDPIHYREKQKES